MKQALALVLLAGCCSLLPAQTPPQPESAASAATATPEAFTLVIEAPEDIRNLLGQHLELLRYQTLSDLSDNELLRLMSAAQDNARDLLATLGYFSPDIQITRTPTSGAQAAAVTLRVTPGAPTLIGEVRITFTGPVADEPAAAAQRQQIQTQWPLRTGMRFTQTGWANAKQQALQQLVRQRYPAGQLAQTQADIDPATQRARLDVTLDSGPAYRLGALQISGAQRYDTELITRLARLTPGTEYDQTQLAQAQQRLIDSGYFDSVFVLLDTSGNPQNAPVKVQLREAMLQKLVLGVGASTDSGARLSLEHTHHKLPLLGWRAVSKLSVDRLTRTLGTELTGTPDESLWRWVTAAHLQNQQEGSFDVRSQRLRAGRSQYGDQIDRNYYLQYDRSQTAAAGATAAVEADSLSANFAFTSRHFDSATNPSRGWGIGAEVGGGSTLGSQRDPYSRLLGRWMAYVPLGQSGDDANSSARSAGRLALRAQAGAVLARESITLPSSQLFLTGGDTSVRGYGLREIGVTLPDGQITAGRYLTFGSVEWQRPITGYPRLADWEATVFLDAGAVADTPGDLQTKVGVGVGARWKSPVGPLQIDLAYGVAAERLRLHLNVGFSF